MQVQKQTESLISVLLFLPPLTYPSLGRGRGYLPSVKDFPSQRGYSLANFADVSLAKL